MPITVTTPANILPVSLQLALRHMRVLESDGDLALLYLQAAVEAVEDYTGRSMITKSYLLSCRGWPTNKGYWNIQSWLSADRHILVNSNTNLRTQELRRTPLVAVQSVQYYADGATTLSTLDPSDYLVDAANAPGRVAFVGTGVDGGTLPAVSARADAVQIAFTAGYGSTESVIPARLKTACLLFARSLFDTRAPAFSGGNSVELPYNLRHMLRSMRVESLTPEVQ